MDIAIYYYSNRYRKFLELKHVLMQNALQLTSGAFVS
jgi:hypothetical protein